MIYIVQIMDWRFAKLGYSADSDISKRIGQLQTGNPFEIKLGLSVQGTIRQEKTLHAMLEAAISVHGHPIPPNEWYHGRSEIFKSFAEALSYGFEYGFAYLAKMDPAMNAVKCESKGRLNVRREWPVVGSYANAIEGQQSNHETINKSIQREMLRKKKHTPRRIRAILDTDYSTEQSEARSAKPEALTL